MQEAQHLPDADRLSVLAATILLAYALARLVDFPGRELAVQLPGIYLSVQVSIRTFVALLVAGLVATGAEWLLRDHPRLSGQTTFEHWLLPALTAWVIGVPLLDLPNGPLWWAGTLIGGTLLMLVLVAEYIVIDPNDDRQPAATAGLTAVSFALFLGLAVALRFENLRLFQMIPALGLAVGLISLRTLHLRLQGRWAFLQAGVVTLAITQLAAALHYWPLSPVAYGLAVLGPAYAMTSLLTSLEEGRPLRQSLVEPLTVLLIVWGLAFWMR